VGFKSQLLILISQQPDDEVSFLRKVVRGLLAVDIILELVYDLATLEEIVREVNTGQVMTLVTAAFPLQER
jgi:hypothetical protein